MPYYGFACDGCGPFDVWLSADGARQQAPCPKCGDEARRVYFAPGLVRTSAPIRAARAAEEESAHQPAIATKKKGRPIHGRHGAPPPWAIGHS